MNKASMRLNDQIWENYPWKVYNKDKNMERKIDVMFFIVGLTFATNNAILYILLDMVYG